MSQTDPFITVAVFSLPQEAYVIRSKLQAMGIEVMLKDELTVQVDNFLSNALGGVKLQVRESALELARPILLEAGLIKEHDPSQVRTKSSFEKTTDRLPVISNWPVSLRAISLTGFVLLVGAILSMVLAPPPSEEELAERKKQEEAFARERLMWTYLPRADSLISANPGLAVAYIKEVQKEFPEDPSLFESLALAYYEIDSLEKAMDNFALSMEYGREHPRGLANMAVCKLELGDAEGAISLLLKAVSLDSNYSYELGAAYEQSEDMANAEKYYTMYLEKLESLNPLITGNADFKKFKTKVVRMRRKLAKGQ